MHYVIFCLQLCVSHTTSVDATMIVLIRRFCDLSVQEDGVARYQESVYRQVKICSE